MLENYKQTLEYRISASESTKRYLKKNPLVKVAHQAVYHAVKMGYLLKESCEICGSTDTQAHHDDYTKPLDVNWLCRKHHLEHHANVCGRPSTNDHAEETREFITT